MANKSILKKKIIAQVRHFAARLREAGIPVEKLIIFGSHAKGTAKSGSDIDLCVVSQKFGKDRPKERLQLMRIQDDRTMDIEPHPYDPKELLDKWDPLAHEIRRYGIRLTL